MPAGRPTLYDPKYCDEVKAFMAQGYSIAGFAGHVGVSRQTVYDWGKDHPEFLDALNQARAASARWWETTAIGIATGKEGNASVAIFGLKNRVADEWRDKQEIDHRSPDGSMTPKGLDLSKLPSHVLAEIVRAADGQSDD
jgi:hypothetical protein